ncbi:RICIN domain-containing protein [Halosolutus gelatinilyticus]|nr:RICIN domain-containing protein [Halosolutus gelatinilyticus]
MARDIVRAENVPSTTAEASTDDGANVVQWSDNGGDHQRWTFESI